MSDLIPQNCIPDGLAILHGHHSTLCPWAYPVASHGNKGPKAAKGRRLACPHCASRGCIVRQHVTQHTSIPLQAGGACLLTDLLTAAQVWPLLTFSLSNLAECTPTTHTGWPAYLRSRAASSGSTCMQLMQQYVQKSSNSTFPFSSLQAPRKTPLLARSLSGLAASLVNHQQLTCRPAAWLGSASALLAPGSGKED